MFSCCLVLFLIHSADFLKSLFIWCFLFIFKNNTTQKLTLVGKGLSPADFTLYNSWWTSSCHPWESSQILEENGLTQLLPHFTSPFMYFVNSPSLLSPVTQQSFYSFEVTSRLLDIWVEKRGISNHSLPINFSLMSTILHCLPLI